MAGNPASSDTVALDAVIVFRTKEERRDYRK
jgi:hypothetical protein